MSVEAKDAEAEGLVLASGRRVEVKPAEDGDWLTIRGRDGACVLTVLLTDAGPVLRFEAAALQVAATRAVEISCEDFRVSARNELHLVGREVDLTARLGGVRVRADDDVAIDGERVLLNSNDLPTQLTWEEFLQQRGRGEEP